MTAMKKRQNIFRGVIYTLGMLSLALGIILNTKTNLGVAPIASSSYAISQITGLNFSNIILCVYTLFAFAEYILMGKNFRPYDLLQIPVSIVFTRCMNFFSNNINLQPEMFVSKIALALVACAFTAVGLSLSVSMRLVPNTGDGLVQAIADRTGKNLGLIKNIFDGCCIGAAVIIGLVFAGKLIGIGLGTVIALILTGRFVHIFNKLFLKQILKLAFGEEAAKK